MGKGAAGKRETDERSCRCSTRTNFRSMQVLFLHLYVYFETSFAHPLSKRQSVERNKHKQEQIVLEKQAIEKNIQEFEAEEQEKRDKHDSKMFEYQASLQKQIQQIHISREKNEYKKLEELAADKEADRRYKALLESEMTRIRNMPM